MKQLEFVLPKADGKTEKEEPGNAGSGTDFFQIFKKQLERPDGSTISPRIIEIPDDD